MGESHRILVTDDDPVVRDSYRSFFSRQSEFEICGEARTGAEAVEAYARLRPDVALMDLQMPVLSGIGATEQICARFPDACVVAMTTFATSEHVVAALRAGASGYLLKDVGGPGLLSGLRQALAGEMPLSSAIRRELVTEVVSGRRPDTSQASADPGLTPREREVVQHLALGLTNAQIGGQMYLSEGSVKQYLLSVSRKLGVKSRTGILVRAIQLDVVDPHSIELEQD